MFNVIIIEDDPMVSAIDRQYVEMTAGFRVTGMFDGGISALKGADFDHTDLIILDYFMPEMNGDEFINQLHRTGWSPAIIMVTSANDTETVTSLFRHGVVDYLVKPFEYERFRSALERFSARMNVLSGTSGTVSQSDIDRLISPSSSGEPGKNTLAKGLNAPTLNLIRSFLKKHPEDSFTSEQISKEVNLSRITVRRYVNHMLEIGELTSTIDYQTGGRPGIHYKYCKV
ncbi:response regulator [[Clostridium] aminophilum]|uniref:response regulator n=1 Tax=[Clostridium] aminophilum TaxID=1526 RepID=UPI0033262C0C